MADTVIEVPGYGNVAFPDSMSDGDIAAAIKTKFSIPSSNPKSTTILPPEPEQPSFTDDLLGRALRTIDVPRQAVLSYAAGKPLSNAIEQTGDPTKTITGAQVIEKQFPGSDLAEPKSLPMLAGRILTESALEMADPTLLLGKAIPQAAKGIGEDVAAIKGRVIPSDINTLRRNAEQLVKEGATAAKTGEIARPAATVVTSDIPKVGTVTAPIRGTLGQPGELDRLKTSVEEMRKKEVFTDDMITATNPKDHIEAKNVLNDMATTNDPAEIVKGIAEPNIVTTKTAEGEQSVIKLKNKINANRGSGLNDKQAFQLGDIPEIDNKDFQIGNDLDKIKQATKAPGLSSMADDASQYVKVPEAGAVGDAAALKETNTPPTGGNKIPPAKPFEQGNVPLSTEHTSESQMFGAIVKPTWRVAADFEQRTKVPLFSRLYLTGRRIADQMTEFKLGQQKQLEEVFGDFYGNTKFKREAQVEITRLLEGIKDYDGKTFTLKDSAPMGLSEAANKLNSNNKLVEAAGRLRKYYNDLSKAGAIDPEQFLDFYSPRLKTDADRFKFTQRFAGEDMAFFQHHRTGNLLPREDNSLTLANRYISALAQKKYFTPFDKQVWQPMKGLLDSDVARKFFDNYVTDVGSIPREAATRQNERLNKLLDSVASMGDKKTHDAVETMRAWMGKDRAAEVLVNKFNSLQYKSLLGYRPVAALRNATQRLFAIPLVGEQRLASGRYLAATKAGKEKALMSGILGPAGDILETDTRVTKMGRPLAGYQRVEDMNRASIYLPLHDEVNKLFNQGVKFDSAAKQLNLKYYPQVIQDHFKMLYEAGKVGDIRTYGPSNNAAHFLGDMAQIMTQFPYEKGGGLELFRQSPLAKAGGAFQSWWLFTGDYLGNVIKDAASPIQNANKLFRTARMMGYFYLMDAAYEGITGRPFITSPWATLPVNPAPPVVQLANGAWQYGSAHMQNIHSLMVSGRENEYTNLKIEQAKKNMTNALMAFTGPGPYAAREMYKMVTGK